MLGRAKMMNKYTQIIELLHDTNEVLFTEKESSKFREEIVGRQHDLWEEFSQFLKIHGVEETYLSIVKEHVLKDICSFQAILFLNDDFVNKVRNEDLSFAGFGNDVTSVHQGLEIILGYQEKDNTKSKVVRFKKDLELGLNGVEKYYLRVVAKIYLLFLADIKSRKPNHFTKTPENLDEDVELWSQSGAIFDQIKSGEIKPDIIPEMEETFESIVKRKK